MSAAAIGRRPFGSRLRTLGRVSRAVSRQRAGADRCGNGVLEGGPCPAGTITVVHRSNPSGTTYLWSEFLSRSSPDWKAKVGAAKVLNWPVGVADVGNEGVASSVQRTKVSIGYVEYAYAKQRGFGVASVRNRDGVFVRPGRSRSKRLRSRQAGVPRRTLISC